MTGWGSDKVAYEMETNEDNFDKSQKKYREKQWNEEEGEW